MAGMNSIGRSMIWRTCSLGALSCDMTRAAASKPTSIESPLNNGNRTAVFPSRYGNNNEFRDKELDDRVKPPSVCVRESVSVG